MIGLGIRRILVDDLGGLGELAALDQDVDQDGGDVAGREVHRRARVSLGGGEVDDINAPVVAKQGTFYQAWVERITSRSG